MWVQGLGILWNKESAGTAWAQNPGTEILALLR